MIFEKANYHCLQTCLAHVGPCFAFKALRVKPPARSPPIPPQRRTSRWFFFRGLGLFFVCLGGWGAFFFFSSFSGQDWWKGSAPAESPPRGRVVPFSLPRVRRNVTKKRGGGPLGDGRLRSRPQRCAQRRGEARRAPGGRPTAIAPGSGASVAPSSPLASLLLLFFASAAIGLV